MLYEVITQILGIVDDINLLNQTISKIVSESQEISDSLRTQSRATIGVVETMSSDIDDVVNETGQLSLIGKQVEDELDSIS